MARINIDGTVDSYRISDMDDTSDPKYFGYLDKFGNWFIMQLTSTTVRYCRGYQNYTDKWTNRSTQNYKLFNESFRLGGGEA